MWNRKDGKLPFLDVIVIRKDYYEVETIVYRESTNSDTYVFIERRCRY